MRIIILVVFFYVVGQIVYVYNSDAKIKAKCKKKGGLDTIGILLQYVREKHKAWYNGSDLQDTMDDLAQEGKDFAQEIKTEGTELMSDLKQEGNKVVAKAKKVVTKKTTNRKTPTKKTPVKKKTTTRKPTVKKTTTKKSA